MESPNLCIACRSNRWRRAIELEQIARTRFVGVTIWQCRQCGLGQLYPLPSTEQIELIYRDPNYGLEYERAGERYVLHADALTDELDRRLEKIQRYLAASRRLLDVGAARGHFLDHARRLHWDVAGLETDPKALAYAQEHYQLTLIPHTLEDAHFAENTFDCIHLSHVFEHLRDPAYALERIRHWLDTPGMVAIEVPYEFGDLFERFRKIALGKPRNAYAVQSPHIYFFTLQSLKSLLSRCGFDVRETATIRRNRSLDSRITGGRFVKRGLYWLEERLQLGPFIEILATKRTS